jgi:hypothetical protein
MITEHPQPITCFISAKSEIPRDHAAPMAQTRRASPRTALTHHAPLKTTAFTAG